MNLQSLVVVVLRLMALDFVLRVVLLWPPQMFLYSRKYDVVAQFEPSLTLALLPWLVFVGLLVCAVVIWFLADPIARVVTRGVSRDISFGAMSLVDCYSIAFMAVGLVYIASHLPQVLNWTHYLLKAVASRPGDAWKEGVRWYDVSQAFIPFIVGVVLFVNGRKWSVALARKQEMTESPNRTEGRSGVPPISGDPQ